MTGIHDGTYPGEDPFIYKGIGDDTFILTEIVVDEMSGKITTRLPGLGNFDTELIDIYSQEPPTSSDSSEIVEHARREGMHTLREEPDGQIVEVEPPTEEGEDDFRNRAGEAALAHLGGVATQGWTVAACKIRKDGALGTDCSPLDPSFPQRLDRAEGVLAVVAGARKQAAARKEQLEGEDHEAELRTWGV